MTDTTPHLGLPLIAAGQAQKHVTHNEALAQLDALVHLACLDKDLSAPPANPSDGDRYLVLASAPTGAWSGLSGQVVRYADGVWIGAAPAAGWRAFIVDERALYVFDGQSWAKLGGGSPSSPGADRLGINTQADATNRLAVKSDAALFACDDVTPGTGDMRITLNKKAAARDAAFVFQTGYSSRALFGTLGSDDFVLKTSPDGSAFTTALTASAATGAVSFAASPTAPTPAAADGSTRLATTAYVDRAVTAVRTAGTPRTQVSDANYAVLATDRTVAMIALTAPRTLSLPAASAFPQGTTVTVVDESGACSAANTITVARAGSDTVNGLAAATLATAFGYLALQSNGTNKWTVVNRAPLSNRRTLVDVAVLNGTQKIGSAFTRIAFTKVNSDVGANWDTKNNWYVCPVSGVYLLTGAIRIADGTATGTQYGVGVHINEEDTPFFLWTAMGPSPSSRSSYAYSRLAPMNAGDCLRMISYADTSVMIVAAGLQIGLVADAA